MIAQVGWSYLDWKRDVVRDGGELKILIFL